MARWPRSGLWWWCQDWVKSKVLAVIDGTKDRYFCNSDKTKIFVPTKDYANCDVHERQVVLRCRKERKSRTQPARSVADVAVPPPPPPPNPNSCVQLDPGVYTSMVAELTAACKEKRRRSDPQAVLPPAPLRKGNVCHPLPSDSFMLFSCPGPCCGNHPLHS